MLDQGLAIATVNHKLKTAKVYAGLAAKAGIIDPSDYTLIRTVASFAPKEFNRVDEKRGKVRTSTKKQHSTVLHACTGARPQDAT